MKKQILKISRIIATFLLSVISLFCGQASLFAFPVFADSANVQEAFENINVLDDLKSDKNFNLLEYPYYKGSTPEMYVINVVEFCYSFRKDKSDDYGLYLYVYNPNGQNIKTDSLHNQVLMATAYKTNPVTETSKPTDYEYFKLQFCSASEAKDKSEWVITYNNHEAIISQELWDKVHERMKSVAQGRKTKTGFVHPLSGFLICADCGAKLKMSGSRSRKGEYHYHFDCGYHLRYGKTLCFSHFIPAKVLEEIVLSDIREMAQRIVLDEELFREEFIRQNEELADKAVKTAKKELQVKRKRTEELSRLMQMAYEDRMKGKMPEDICIGFIQKYSEEQKTLVDEIAEIESELTEKQNNQQSADDFIRNIKKYLNVPELTREMCYELIDRIVVGGLPKITGKERTIDIVYKIDVASVLRYKFNK